MSHKQLGVVYYHYLFKTWLKIYFTHYAMKKIYRKGIHSVSFNSLINFYIFLDIGIIINICLRYERGIIRLIAIVRYPARLPRKWISPCRTDPSISEFHMVSIHGEFLKAGHIIQQYCVQCDNSQYVGHILHSQKVFHTSLSGSKLWSIYNRIIRRGSSTANPGHVSHTEFDKQTAVYWKKWPN